MSRLRLQSEQTELVVLSVLREEPLYGYAIGKRVAARSAGEISLGPSVLYPLLTKLEQSKLVLSDWEEVKAERAEPGATGRKRKWYRLSAKGLRRLEQRIEAHRRFTSLMESFMGPDAELEVPA